MGISDSDAEKARMRAQRDQVWARRDAEQKAKQSGGGGGSKKGGC